MLPALNDYPFLLQAGHAISMSISIDRGEPTDYIPPVKITIMQSNVYFLFVWILQCSLTQTNKKILRTLDMKIIINAFFNQIFCNCQLLKHRLFASLLLY